MTDKRKCKHCGVELNEDNSDLEEDVCWECIDKDDDEHDDFTDEDLDEDGEEYDY